VIRGAVDIFSNLALYKHRQGGQLHDNKIRGIGEEGYAPSSRVPVIAHSRQLDEKDEIVSMGTREGGTGPKAGRHTSVNPPPQPLGATVEPIREICVPAGGGVEVTPYVKELVRSWCGFRGLCS